jgi:hypothetical protein
VVAASASGAPALEVIAHAPRGAAEPAVAGGAPVPAAAVADYLRGKLAALTKIPVERIEAGVKIIGQALGDSDTRL